MQSGFAYDPDHRIAFESPQENALAAERLDSQECFCQLCSPDELEMFSEQHKALAQL